MSRPKKGTKGAEEAVLRWRETMQREYGGAAGVHDMMSIIGAKGGRVTGVKKGFAANTALAREMGKTAGRISKRGFKYLGTEGKYRKYLDKKTGKVVKYLIREEIGREDV